MKKVILLALMMPYMASSQIIGSSGKNGYDPAAGDVIISEIMADPLPEVSLPGKEYIELFNRGDNPVNIKGWRLLSGESIVILPDVVIAPSGYLVICHEDNASLFSFYGNTAGVSRFPALTDGGKLLCLQDASGELIHGVEYSSLWYGDAMKADGGWSLEMVDTRFPFFSEGNWKASSSKKGGTPGTENSVSGTNPDSFFHGITNVFPQAADAILIQFTEPVLTLTPDRGSLTIGGIEIRELVAVDPLFRRYMIVPEQPLEEFKFYELSVSEGIKDFAGNPMEKADFKFGIPQRAGAGDIRFNEIMFNPYPGEADYIELINTSERIIDASRLFLVSVNSYGDTSKLYPASVENRCIMPAALYAITTAKEKICQRYFSADPDCLFEVSSLPSMNDDEGHLILLNRELDIIDEVRYRDEMHFSLLSGHEGIALEKTGPFNSSLDESSWHSASESAGWGTPGRRNSVFPETQEAAAAVSLSSTKISPDNDGYEDFLSLHLSLAGQGNIVSVSVFDETGSLINKVASNMLAGPAADIVWDGTTDDGNLAERGIYIVLVTVYNDKGKTWQWKKACAVLRR